MLLVALCLIAQLPKVMAAVNEVNDDAVAKNIIPEFVGGLNVRQINQCEVNYIKKCSISESQSGMEGITKQWACMESAMSKDKSCAQAYMIHKLTSYPPTNIRQFDKKIAVFTTTALADGQITFYIVDKRGQLIRLTEDDNLVNKDPNYILLKKTYPNLSFTSFIFWSKLYEDVFPKFQPLTTPTKTNPIKTTTQPISQLVFKQELRDGPCVACEPLAIVYVAYQFNPLDEFTNIQLLKIEPLPKKLNK